MAVEIETVPDVFVRIVFSRDLPAEVMILFDRGLTKLYIMEDMAVLLVSQSMLKNLNSIGV